jgi:hypothetical protein
MTRPIVASKPFWLGVATAIGGLSLAIAAGSLWLS